MIELVPGVKNVGRRFIRRALLGLASLAVTLILAIVLGTIVPLSPEHPADGGPKHHRILIVASAIHTDIALPVDSGLVERFGFLRNAGLPVERANWLLIGRGGRSFYLETPNWSDLKAGPLLRALTLDTAVMHVGLAGPFEPDSATREFVLNDTDYEALLASIEKDFASRAPIPGAGYGAYDRFFEATGSFNALVGCNVWTSATLRQAGITTGFWTPLPLTLRWSLDLHGTRKVVDDVQ